MPHAALNRKLIQEIPFTEYAGGSDRPPWEFTPEWPARWLALPSPTGFALYRLTICLEKPLNTRIHITADERYELYVDGRLAALGSERGDGANWFFESFDLHLPAGKHVLTARVWALGSNAPWAQVSIRPGFLLAAEGDVGQVLSTGLAAWRVCRLEGISWRSQSTETGGALGGGPGFIFDCGKLYDECAADDSLDWQPAELGELPATANSTFVSSHRHYLKPAMLPGQKRSLWVGAVVRYAAYEDIFFASNQVINENAGDAGLQALLAPLVRDGACCIAANTTLRAIIDLGDYVCQYPLLSVAKGSGAIIRLRFAETLCAADGQPRGNHDVIDGKIFRGLYDEIRADGREHRLRMPWWRAGRYVQLEIHTKSVELEIRELTFEETRFELGQAFVFSTNIPGVEAIAKTALRTLRMCSHETHMDCPYYEQLQYVGDTRLQVLLSFYLDPAVPLGRKALVLMDSSRQNSSGLTRDSAPGEGKLIPPFALWWVAMIADYARWRGDPQLIGSMLPGAREVSERFVGMIDSRGLLVSGRGWNYVDVADGFTYGVPPGGKIGGTSAVLHLHLIYTLMQLAEMEEHFGIMVLAQHWRTLAGTLMATAEKYCWDSDRQLFADDLEHKSFSQHAQAMAVLTGLLDDNRARQIIGHAIQDKDIIPCDIYFANYLFEATCLYDGGDYLRHRLQDWHALIEQGCKTFPEHFGQSRSQCHAWSSHVLYHILHTIAGIKPVGPAMRRVRIEPNLQPGEWLKTSVAHPAGMIHVDLRMDKELHGTIIAPHGVEIESLAGKVKVENVK